MSAANLIAALALPAGAAVNQRVAKKLLLENGAPTAADKRAINEGIEELVWVAALKPTTIGVPEYRDAVREYLEIAVLRLGLRPDAKEGRLTELVHRAVPYPVFLVAEHEGRANVSLAHKRWSQGEAGKTVLEGDVVLAAQQGNGDAALWATFREALPLDRKPRTSLYDLYDGWVNAALTLRSAHVTGAFALPASAEHAAARRAALQDHARVEVEIARLRTVAAKERQLARRVELNLELKRLQAEQAAARMKM